MVHTVGDRGDQMVTYFQRDATSETTWKDKQEGRKFLVALSDCNPNATVHSIFHDLDNHKLLLQNHINGKVQRHTPFTTPFIDVFLFAKVNTLFESLRSEDPHYANEGYLRNTVNYAPKYQKRTRTVSPSSTKRELEAKRLEREKQKRERREQEILSRRQLREQRFMSEILADVPEGEAGAIAVFSRLF